MENYIQQIKKQHLQNTKLAKKLNQEKNEHADTIKKLQSFRDKLYLDIMVPIPSNDSPIAFIEGTAVHTNELLVSLGAKYFATMTVKDTIEYCNRKCEDIDQSYNNLVKEQKLLLERISFLKLENVEETEIVEHYNEHEEKQWRQRHKESVKKMKAQEAIERVKVNQQPAEDYFLRLEELEAEELESINL